MHHVLEVSWLPIPRRKGQLFPGHKLSKPVGYSTLLYKSLFPNIINICMHISIDREELLRKKSVFNLRSFYIIKSSYQKGKKYLCELPLFNDIE